MDTILIIDPQGIKRKVPYSDLEKALGSKGKFASKEEQQKAISLSQAGQMGQMGQQDPGAYLDKLSESKSALKKLPSNILTGLAHAGRNLANLPHDVAKLAEWPAEKLVGPLKHPLSSYLPYDVEDYSDVLGGNKEQDTILDKLIKGGIEYAPDIIGGASLVRSGFRRLTGAHELSEVARRANQSGLDIFRYHPNTLEEARNYLPRSRATEEMLARSEAGQYNPSFAVQSQMGHHQRNLAKSPLASEQLMAPQVGDLKQTMLNELGDIFRSAGMIEEAELLSRGINNYRTYKKILNGAKKAIKYAGLPTTILGGLGLLYNKAKKL